MDIYIIMEMDYCLFVDVLEKFLKKIAQNVILKKQEQSGFIGCNIFNIYIESVNNSEECDFQLVKDEYDIETNISAYINIFTDQIEMGIRVIYDFIIFMENKYNCDMIIYDDSTKVVYIKSKNRYFIDQNYWFNKQ